MIHSNLDNIELAGSEWRMDGRGRSFSKGVPHLDTKSPFMHARPVEITRLMSNKEVIAG